MTTRSAPTRARRLGLGLSALAAAALLGLSAPVPVLGPDTGAACTGSSSSCGG